MWGLIVIASVMFILGAGLFFSVTDQTKIDDPYHVRYVQPPPGPGLFLMLLAVLLFIAAV